jgi:hypothetical protein
VPAVVTVTPLPGTRRPVWVVEIVETAAAAASEVPVPGLPQVGVIRSYEATLVSGAGANINPKGGRAAGFAVSTQNHIFTQGTTAAHIHDDTPVRYCLAEGGSMYVRSSVNAGADNVIHTRMLITSGAED